MVPYTPSHAALGSRTASAGRAVWGTASRPFRGGWRQRQPSPAPGDVSAPPPGLPPLQRVSGGGLTRSSPTVAAARSSALFRAAVLRMMSEQQREVQQAQQGGWDVEQGGAAQAPPLQAGSSGPGGPGSFDWRGSSAGGSSSGAGGSQQQRSVARTSPAPSGSTDALYARILEDIAAVAAAPTTSSGRRRQRRRERDSRRRQAAGAAAPDAGPSGRTSSSRADHSEGSGEEDAAVRAALGRPPSTPAVRDGRSGSRARPQEAVDRAAAVVHRSAGAGSGGAAPTWDDLMALLAVHSLEQAARRQSARAQAVVPLVSLEAPPPAAAPAGEPGSSSSPAAPN